MQKLINVMAVTSFAVSAGIVAGGSYVYLNREAIIDNVRDRVAEEIGEAIPGIVKGLMPKVPSVPGVPSGGSGSSIPGLPF